MSTTLISSLISFFLGFCFFRLYHAWKCGSYEKLGQEILHSAELLSLTKKQQLELSLKQLQIDKQKELEELKVLEKKKLQKEFDRLRAREEKLEERSQNVEKKIYDMAKTESDFITRRLKLEALEVELTEQVKKNQEEKERIAEWSIKEARDSIIECTKEELKQDRDHLIYKSLKQVEEEIDQRANEIIASAIQRLAVPCVSERTVNTVSIPNKELKGRIIGREGRNIRALETCTGVNLTLDEAGNAILLSCYDPVRLHIAKLAIEELLSDGRIHPTRIEEIVEKYQGLIQKEMKIYGEEAVRKAGIMPLHSELIVLLGRLKFRYSFGQNILEHSIEVAHLMGLMAAEMKLDIQRAKRIGLLHDIGKAVSHEVEGSHAIVGHQLALKYGESKEVANGIGCHHFEMKPFTIEASLCSSADAISASRPGSRVEPIEEELKRISRLEEMALEFPCVEKAYAMQAGRELRAFVFSNQINDEGTMLLARDLSKKIEKELMIQGRVKVTVIRETRVVEYAL